MSSSDPLEILATIPGVLIRPGGVRFVFSRSSGPGGQAVNKVSSRATLRICVGDIRGLDELARARVRLLAGSRLTHDDEILISAETSRSQLDNKRFCAERLRDLIIRARIRPKKRKKSRPSRSMIEKRLEGKRRQSHKKNLRRQGRPRQGDE